VPLIRLGKHAMLLPDLALAVKDAPGEPTIHFLLASVLPFAGKTADAQHEMQTYGRLQERPVRLSLDRQVEANAIKKDAH